MTYVALYGQDSCRGSYDKDTNWGQHLQAVTKTVWLKNCPSNVGCCRCCWKAVHALRPNAQHYSKQP